MKKSSFPENKRVTRIKKIMELENIDQQDLAAAIDMFPQNFSRFMVSGNVSEKTCRKINEVYPQYPLEWILGYVDYITPEAQYHDYQLRADIVSKGIMGMIDKTLKPQGKTILFRHRQIDEPHANTRMQYDCYYVIVDADGNELKRLTAEEMIRFEMQIQEYCDFMTERHLLK